MKTIIIKLTRSGPRNGPFDVYDQYGNLLFSSISKESLIVGRGFTVEDDVSIVTLTDSGVCADSVTKSVGVVYINQLTENNYTRTNTACLWKHLKDITKFNEFYGETEPYIIEYSFNSTSGADTILQSVTDYTQAYKYLDDDETTFDRANKIETDDEWFNKAVVYNGQQSSGMLLLVAKPQHNLRSYMSYPIFNTDSKTITFTKSDSFYRYNDFWNVANDKTKPLFTMTCESMSIDKIVNQSNMDYSSRSYSKQPLRGKYAKIRHILDDKNDVHLVSQFLLTTNQISYK